ncbi:MAG TPA: hypothetical protein VIY27_08435 [Myxococcota bacterium]
MSTATSPHRSSYDDPRELRNLLDKASQLARVHELRSVVVGLAGFEGDLEFPEVVDYVESALRMDDSLFRMTRERAVVLLTDVDRKRALEIMERLLHEFRERFPSLTEPTVALGYYEVAPGDVPAIAKVVLPHIFEGSPQAH